MSEITISPAHPDGAGAQSCLAAYFAELTPPNGVFLVAWLAGRAVGCGALVTLEPGIGEIKQMWVDSTASGRGLGKRMLASLESSAVGLGMRGVYLDTNRALREAQQMYRSAGYEDAKPYSENPYADFWFYKSLAGGSGAS